MLVRAPDFLLAKDSPWMPPLLSADLQFGPIPAPFSMTRRFLSLLIPSNSQ